MLKENIPKYSNIKFQTGLVLTTSMMVLKIKKCGTGDENEDDRNSVDAGDDNAKNANASNYVYIFINWKEPILWKFKKEAKIKEIVIILEITWLNRINRIKSQ